MWQRKQRLWHKRHELWHKLLDMTTTTATTTTTGKRSLHGRKHLRQLHLPERLHPVRWHEWITKWPRHHRLLVERLRKRLSKSLLLLVERLCKALLLL